MTSLLLVVSAAVVITERKRRDTFVEDDLEDLF
jgi:hypothetical protein